MDDRIILLVEDNLDDVLLMLDVLLMNNIGNKVVVVKNGVEVLDYMFGIGMYEGWDILDMFVIVLLDLKLLKIDGFEVLC